MCGHSRSSSAYSAYIRHPPSAGTPLLSVTPRPVAFVICRPFDYSLYCSHDTCMHAQVRFSCRCGLAPFIAYSGTHTSHTRCHTCYLCIRLRPFRSYLSLISRRTYTHNALAQILAHCTGSHSCSRFVLLVYGYTAQYVKGHRLSHATPQRDSHQRCYFATACTRRPLLCKRSA